MEANGSFLENRIGELKRNKEKVVKKPENQIEREYKLRQKNLPPCSTKITIITQHPSENKPREPESFREIRSYRCESKRQSHISLDSFIKKQHQVKLQPKEKQEKNYCGNPLDSSQPARSVGKHRETLKEKVPSKLKQDIIKQELEAVEIETVSDYCDNVITSDLNEAVAAFIRKLVDFQEKSFKTNPVKAKAKRRYIAGLHETRKYLVCKKVKVLIIAADLRIYDKEDLLYKKIDDLKYLATENNIPCIFALKRYKIGNLLKKHQAVSCVGILNEQSAEDELNCILKNIDKVNKNDKE